MSADAQRSALVHAVLRRELRPARLVGASVVVGGAFGAFGRELAARGLASGAMGGAARPWVVPALGAGPGDVVLALLARAVVPAFALAAAYLVVDRVTADHEAGWLPALAAAGGRRLRAAYALAVPAGVLAAVVPLAGLAVAALALGAGADAAAALRLATGALPGAAMFALAVAAYALAVAVALRRRRAALTVAAVGVLAPVAGVAWWQAAAGQAPPAALVWSLGAHLPLLAWHGNGRLLVHHALYAAVVLSLVAAAAPRLVARER